MTVTLTDAPPLPDADPARRRPWHWRPWRWVVGVVALLAAVALVGGGVGWWFAGGPHLRMYPMDGGGILVVGQTWTFGVELNSDHGTVELSSARASGFPADVATQLTITKPMGMVVGDIAAQGYNPRPVRGTRVHGDGPGQAVFLSASLTPHRAGLVSVGEIDATYRAGPRTRTARSQIDMCLLVVEKKDLAKTIAEFDRATTAADRPSNDPAFEQYLECTDR